MAHVTAVNQDGVEIFCLRASGDIISYEWVLTWIGSDNCVSQAYYHRNGCCYGSEVTTVFLRPTITGMGAVMDWK